MAKCAICEKAAHFGIKVSHSHRRSNKMWKANVKSVKVKVNGGTQRMYVCTSCLRSGLVEELNFKQNRKNPMASLDCRDFLYYNTSL